MSEAKEVAKALRRCTQRNDWRKSGTHIDRAAALLGEQAAKIEQLEEDLFLSWQSARRAEDD